MKLMLRTPLRSNSCSLFSSPSPARQELHLLPCQPARGARWTASQEKPESSAPEALLLHAGPRSRRHACPALPRLWWVRRRRCTRNSPTRALLGTRSEAPTPATFPRTSSRPCPTLSVLVPDRVLKPRPQHAFVPAPNSNSTSSPLRTSRFALDLPPSLSLSLSRCLSRCLCLCLSRSLNLSSALSIPPCEIRLASDTPRRSPRVVLTWFSSRGSPRVLRLACFGSRNAPCVVRLA
mmetsp:Transcript_14797/g.39652  ORF Transcript_14797/g.39652 Transcript_14797/m.39652 type:complete len:236 (-) Transcript_14797:2556-3263(-)